MFGFKYKNENEMTEKKIYEEALETLREYQETYRELIKELKEKNLEAEKTLREVRVLYAKLKEEV